MKNHMLFLITNEVGEGTNLDLSVGLRIEGHYPLEKDKILTKKWVPRYETKMKITVNL